MLPIRAMDTTPEPEKQFKPFYKRPEGIRPFSLALKNSKKISTFTQTLDPKVHATRQRGAIVVAISRTCQ